MTIRTRRLDIPAACLVVLLAYVHVASAQTPPASEPAAAAPIPASEIAALEAELAKKDERASSTQKRMACKGIMREGEALLEAHPAAPNRYRVLGIVFQSQKRLLGLENSDRNRGELFDTCKELAQAPDEYADLRLEADLLLSERDLAAKGATLQERAKALAALVARYRDTRAEAKSLMMAALIAPKLDAPDLEDEIFEALNARFADDPGVIEFIQKNLGISRLDVLFSGTFTRIDGVELRFPVDLMGHLGLMVFWSRETPGFELYLKQIKEQQSLLPDRFEVFSFNLDELPDGGEAALRALELDWTVMRLPGGRKSQTFRTYGQKDPLGILVNAYGHAVLAPMVVRKTTFKIEEARVSDERYLAQLQSLFIGDFLVTDMQGSLDPSLPPELKMIPVGADAPAPAGLSRTAESVPAETLRAIQACFASPPFRYRQTTAEALANYTKAEKLCCEAIEKHPAAPDLWLVRNRRIIALLGMWNITGEPKHLECAVRESRASLAAKLPPGADVVPRFCLAKEAIRRGDSDPKSILAALIEETGGPDAPCSAVAAATILALDAQSPDLHKLYRGRLLEASDGGNPMLWPVVSFLCDRYHRCHLFKGNCTRPEDRSLRSYVVANGAPPTMDRLPDVELKTLDGRTLTLPKDAHGKLTLLLFVEPPADKGQTKFPREVMSVMQYATSLADQHVPKEVSIVAAFLCDDANRVDALMKANALACRAAMVPGGLASPLVRRLGILSADRIPNVFVVRRDGAVAWHTSGLKYKADFGYPFAAFLAMKVHIEVCDLEIAYKALEQGDFRKAVRYFSTPYVPDTDQRYQWAAPRLHGLAMAHMGLKQWDAALADIDEAIEAHRKGFDDAKTGPCDVMAEMRLIRATTLDQLGRKEEAAAERKAAAVPASAHHTTPYGLFHARLRALRRNQNQEMEKK